MSLFGWEKVSRDATSYKACVALTTSGGAIVGMIPGSVVPGAGTLAGYAGGAVWGFAIGYLACPYLAPAVRRKLETGMPLSHTEIRSAAEAMGSYAGINGADDAVKLVGMVKALPANKIVAPDCLSPTYAAKRLLGGLEKT